MKREMESCQEPDMKKHDLLCPQCGTHRFFVNDEKGETEIYACLVLTFQPVEEWKLRQR